MNIDLWKGFIISSKAGVPTHQNAPDKVLRLYDKYKVLKQNRHMKSELQRKREADYKESLDDLLNLAGPNALN